jgi:hypothetical protein
VTTPVRHDAKWEMNLHAGLALRTPETKFVREVVMTADRRPLPDDLIALKEIIGGRPAEPQTMQKLITCNLVEELDGTALLTSSGIEAAALLAKTK